MKITYKYWTKSKGTGGRIKSPEDFIVNEVIDKKFLRSFERTSNGVRKVSGPYTIFLLKKSNMTTHEALDIVAQKMSVPVSDIGYAGLKDKSAVTSQYITIRNPKAEKIELDYLSLVRIGATNRHISIGNLTGNEFLITLHGCKNANSREEIMKALSKGIPNYFGLQRFGSERNNHIVGKCLINRDFNGALRIINKTNNKEYRSVNDVDKKALKFFVHAYQSWIFNEALNTYISKNKKPLFRKMPIVGFDTKISGDFMGKIMKSILRKEKIIPSAFRISELNLSCSGGERDAFIKVNAKIDSRDDEITLSFALPKGSYATNVIREIAKNE